MAAKSLLIVGFPRGLTSEAHRIASSMLNDLDPTAVMNGELLNHQRNPAVASSRRIPFYLTPSHPEFSAHYSRCAEALASHSVGHLLKDVVQPWIVQRFLRENPNALEVLFIDRPLAHVRFALARRQWIFPHRLETVRAVYRRYPTLTTARLINDADSFYQALSERYPAARRVDYLDQQFINRRERFFETYSTEEWNGYLRNIDFADTFRLEGFGEFSADIGGYWSVRPRSEIEIDCSRLLIRPDALRLRLLAPLNERRRALHLRVVVDGAEAGDSEFVLPRELVVRDFRLPTVTVEKLARNQSARVRVVLVNSEIASPASLLTSYDDGGFPVGLRSTDTTRVGVGVISAGFTGQALRTASQFPMAP